MPDPATPPPRTPPRAILICATPRSGSTLFCTLLTATGVAGRPESWFRAEDRRDYAADWGIAPGPDGHIPFAPFLAAAIRAGQSRNGVFAARIMAATRRELLADLRALYGPLDAAALIARTFGPARHVHLFRRDTVAQAVSRHRAETEGLWHLNADGTPREVLPPGPEARPGYDAAAIDRFRREAEGGNRSWRAWFARHGIAPCPVAYEDLAADPEGTVRRTLAALGLPDPGPAPLAVATARLADAESAARAARFRAERGLARRAALPLSPRNDM